MSANLSTKIPDDVWEAIVKKIHTGDCVPFLGAGVNVRCGNEDSLPLGGEVALQLLKRMVKGQQQSATASYGIGWKNLTQYRQDARAFLNDLRASMGQTPAALDEKQVEDLAKKILKILPDEEAKLAHIIIDESLDQYQELTRVALQDLARVSLRYRRNKNLPDFVSTLKEIIPDDKCRPSRLLRMLSAMPFKLIVTTNYDRLMERALELFDSSALIKPELLTETIRACQTALAQFIYEMVSEQMMTQLKANEAIRPELWLDELNALIQQTRLYLLEDKKRKIDPASSELAMAPEGNESIRRNRLFLEQSFPDALKPHDKPYELIVQPINGFKGTEENQNRIMLSRNDRLILYKLHGTFTDTAPREETRPVITEEDYIEFLTYVGGKGENIDNQITSRIKSSTLLFLGYSLEDWNFRALFKGLVEKVDLVNRPVSFAIQKDPSDFWVRFWEGSNRNVRIFNVDLCDFTADLEERYEAHRKLEEEKESFEQAKAKQMEEKRKERRANSGRA